MKHDILIVDLKKHRLIGEAAYGKYFRLNSKKGVKIFKSWGYSKPESAIKRMGVATQEALNLKKAEKSKLTPKLYKVCIAQVGKQYYPAIVMQHFENHETASKVYFEDFNGDSDLLKFSKSLRIKKLTGIQDLYNIVAKRFENRTKAYHADMHGANVLLKVNKGIVTSVKLVDICSVHW